MTVEHTPTNEPTKPHSRLDSWKEIAEYLGKDIRTVERWEIDLGLPVHRVRKGGSVWAEPDELDAWLKRPAVNVTDRPLSRKRRSLLTVTAVGICLIVALSWLASGPSQSYDMTCESPLEQPQGKTFRFHIAGVGMPGALQRWSESPSRDHAKFGPPLHPDTQGKYTWSFSGDCKTEIGRHRFWVQDEEQNRISNVVDIRVLSEPRCGGPLPDLAIESVDVEPSAAVVDATFRVTVRIRNDGPAAAPQTFTRFRLSTSAERSNPTDTALGDHPTPPILPGESAIQTFDLHVPDTVQPGAYYVWGIADNRGDILERQSWNNIKGSLQSIAIAPTAQAPR
jgi:CARDB protein